MSQYAHRLPRLNALVAFEAAHRLGSFTRAADEIALTQASVSRRVRELEQDLGVQLFERRRYDVVPTADGETLATSVRLALNGLAYTADHLRKRGPKSKMLTVFSDLSIANALLAPLVGRFQRRYPEVMLRVLSSYEPIETVRDHFDIGLQYGRWAEDRFDIQPIADDAIFPVCAPAFADQIKLPATADEIIKQPLLHLVDVGREWPDWRSFLAHFRLKEPKPVEGLVFDSYQVCLDVAETGEGIALGWARSVQSRIDSGKLIRLEGMTMQLNNCINVHRPRDLGAHSMAERFLDLLRESIDPIN